MMMIYRSRLWTTSTKSGNLLTLSTKVFVRGISQDRFSELQSILMELSPLTLVWFEAAV